MGNIGKNKKVILYVLIVFGIFYFVPNNYMSNYHIMNNTVLLLSFIFGISNIKEPFPLLLLAYASCFPQVFFESDESKDAIIIGYKNSAILYSILIYYTLKTIRNTKYLKHIKWQYLLYLFLGFVYFFRYNSKFEFTLVFNTFVYLFLFYIIVKENKFSRVQQYIIFDCCFYATFIYVLLQMFFDYSPYPFIHVNTGDVMDNFRASGLFKHPLYLSYFSILYSVYFAYRFLNSNNKIILINLLLATILLIFTASRTSLIGSCIIWAFILYKMNYKKNLTFLIILFIIIVFFCGEYLMNSLDTLNNRMSDSGSISVTNRAGTYGAVWNCFLDNPFGVGFKSAAHLIYTRYKTTGMIADFSTIDNQYLSYISYYGILAFVPFLALYAMFKSEYKKTKGIFEILYFILFLLCFSFNVMNSPYAMMLLASFMAMYNKYPIVKDVTNNI